MLKTILDDQIWEAHHWITMAPGVQLECRMTLIRLADGALFMHSPIPIDDPLAAHIEKLGEVSTIVAPSLFHHMFAHSARVRYPDAMLWAAPGLPEKCPHIPFDEVLGSSDEPPDWQHDIRPLWVEGIPKLNEVLFYHERSSTLVVTDLVFNMHRFQGMMSPVVFRGMGTYKRFAQSRLIKTVITDRERYRRSLLPLLELDITRLIMAHGEIIEGPETRARLLDALNLQADTPGT